MGWFYERQRAEKQIVKNKNMMDNYGIIIQARTGSTRLPKKMILPFYNGKCIIQILLERLKQEFREMPVIVATTTNANDDIIADITVKSNCLSFRGSENDVLDRFISAADKFRLTTVARVCADNPFIDMKGIGTLLDYLANNMGTDYVTFARRDGTPAMKTHYGFWAEAVRVDALKKTASLTTEKLYHEHVTNFIYANKDIFKVDYLPIPEEIDSNNRIRLTLDTAEDFEMQKEIFAEVMKMGGISISNVLDVINGNPEYFERMEKQIIRNSK